MAPQQQQNLMVPYYGEGYGNYIIQSYYDNNGLDGWLDAQEHQSREQQIVPHSGPSNNPTHQSHPCALNRSAQFQDYQSVDLLNDPSSQQVIPADPATNTDNDLALALLLAAEDTPAYATSESIVRAEDIPAEIIAAQTLAFKEAERRQQQRQDHQNELALVPYVSREINLVVPIADNPTGSDAVHPSRPAWKKTRGRKTAVGAAGGAIVGGAIFGPLFPVGMALGGAAGGYATNKLSKFGERRAQRKWEQANYQNDIAQSPAVVHDAVFV